MTATTLEKPAKKTKSAKAMDDSLCGFYRLKDKTMEFALNYPGNPETGQRPYLKRGELVIVSLSPFESVDTPYWIHTDTSLSGDTPYFVNAVSAKYLLEHFQRD